MAASTTVAEFAQVYALPHAQIEPMVRNRDGDGKTDKRRFDMRRHVVITFYGMFIEGFPFLDETVKTVGKIFTDRRVVVFVKSQSRRGVLDEQVQDTCFR